MVAGFLGTFSSHLFSLGPVFDGAKKKGGDLILENFQFKIDQHTTTTLQLPKTLNLKARIQLHIFILGNGGNSSGVENSEL